MILLYFLCSLCMLIDTMIISFTDLIGCIFRSDRYLSLHAYPYSTPSCCSGKPHREHNPHHLVASDENTAKRWNHKILSILHGGEDEKVQRRSILVMLNPASGTGTAIRYVDGMLMLYAHACCVVVLRMLLCRGSQVL